MTTIDINEAALSILTEMLPAGYYSCQWPNLFRIIGPDGIDVADLHVDSAGKLHCWIFWTNDYIMIELCDPNCFQSLIDIVTK